MLIIPCLFELPAFLKCADNLTDGACLCADHTTTAMRPGEEVGCSLASRGTVDSQYVVNDTVQFVFSFGDRTKRVAPDEHT